MIAAKELRKKSLVSCDKELKELEDLMSKASEKGDLSIYVAKISDAAKQALKDTGYTIKLSLVEEHKDKWKVEW